MIFQFLYISFSCPIHNIKCYILVQFKYTLMGLLERSVAQCITDLQFQLQKIKKYVKLRSRSVIIPNRAEETGDRVHGTIYDM